MAAPSRVARRAGPHLLVALHHSSWGRAEMAVRLARRLRQGGEDVHLLIDESLEPLAADLDVRRTVVGTHARRLARLVLEDRVRRLRPASLVYFDFVGTARYFERVGIGETSWLLEFDCPTLTLDPWHYRVTGKEVDAFGESAPLGRRSVLDGLDRLARAERHLIPVPYAHPASGPGAFACLPRPTSPLQRRPQRSSDKAPTAVRRILICSAPWQHSRAWDRGRGRLIDLVPTLVAYYVRELGPRVLLQHVGPEPYPIGSILGRRYRWHPPLPRRDFERMLGSTDLLLSANVSAATIGWALALGVPALVLRNSHSVTSLGQARILLGTLLRSRLLRVLKQSLPIYPFHVWPLGYHRFLDPLLRDNPYVTALRTAEILEPDEVRDAVAELLFDSWARRQAVDREREYVRAVDRLPPVAETFRVLLGGQPATEP